MRQFFARFCPFRWAGGWSGGILIFAEKTPDVNHVSNLNILQPFPRSLTSTMPFTFVLGKFALLFIPPSPDKPCPRPTSGTHFPYPLPSVVQVIVKAAQ